MSEEPAVNFDILYEDAHFVAINKPKNILVHRTKISEDTVFVLQLLRDQLGQRIYPIHRLDRATSGVLIFGKTQEATGELSELMRSKAIHKKYLGLVRGFLDEQGTIDYPLVTKEHLPAQEAITHYKNLAQVEQDFHVNRYPTSRYSLLEITLETGRRHQIRRHFAHLRHPIIGDKRHGDCKHNKYFSKELGIDRMFLHAKEMVFTHPFTKEKIIITASLDQTFLKILEWFGEKGHYES